MMVLRSFLLVLLVYSTIAQQQQPQLIGKTSAVHDLLDRVLGNKNEKQFFVLNITDSDDLFFSLQDDNDKLLVTASSASELSAGIGYYLRHYCNMTIGWPRGGGSRVNIPSSWPKVGSKPITKRRIVPWSYLMNVCTNSYSLVWYDWKDWEQFIDWLSLRGINLILALTGQEEIQYQVFRKLGLKDLDIRSWFNGPAFLTWSRGQNEYGNNICGPLPRSWMRDQFKLQKNFILPRLRELGIVGQLPGFQGNVPIQLKSLYKDTNMTKQGDTGWMDSLDPFYGKMADLYMKTMIESFGTDHWYQLDGYFNGETAPWLQHGKPSNNIPVLEDAGHLHHDEAWFQRGRAAYQGLNRTDPDAVWSFQGFSFLGWDTTKQASAFKGFVDSAPSGKFVVLDMSFTGPGEWQKWNNASFFGAPFVWTALHNFGGTDGIKGDMARINQIVWDILPPVTSMVGLGATPEGIDQNPAYYDFLFGSAFRSAPVQDLHEHMSEWSHKRYGIVDTDTTTAKHVSEAWSLLVDSLYANDFSVQDVTGIAHLNPPNGPYLFEQDRYTPKPVLCKVFQAWEHFLEAAKQDGQLLVDSEPFVYDMVNLGREVLAQISTPASLNFSEATERQVLNKEEILDSGGLYMELLLDTEILVGTDVAFLLGPWIQSARRWGEHSEDCESSVVGNMGDCKRFYEWNARTQITTWNPTSKESSSVPGGPVDYAAKHWSGLIDYYGQRAAILLSQALADEARGVPLNQTEKDRRFANHAYQWTTSNNPYPNATTGDPLLVSIAMYNSYKHWFATCKEGDTTTSSIANQ